MRMWEKTDEDIVKELFVSNLKNTYGENLIEYKVNNIEIYTGSDRQGIANIIGDVADDDIITTVDYSIRLKDVSKDAGNGTLNGDWVLNKFACVQIGHDVTGYKRKIIHTKLQNSKHVKTYSVGEGDRRRIVIAKK